MNSDKRSNPKTRGNALIYVLIALALLGALTMLLSEQGSESDDLSYERTKLLTTKVTAYAASAKHVVDQMTMTGTTMANINYSLPSTPEFETPPHIHKIFHPDGGGLNYFAGTAPPFDGVAATPPNGWYFNEVNVEWTPTSAPDLVFTAYMIDEQICRQINKDITGSTDIPVLTSNSLMHSFLPPALGGGTTELNRGLCEDCEGYPSMCVSNGFGAQPNYGYYNIIVAR